MIFVYLRLLIAFVMLLCATALWAQGDTSTVEKVIRKPTIRSTELHVGIGFQKFIHYGIRQRIGSMFFLGVDMGNFIISYGMGSASVEVGWVPNSTLYNPGLYFGVIYSDISTGSKLFDRSGIFYRVLTGNIGWMTQHHEWLSSIVKAGLGAFQEVTPRQINVRTTTEIRYKLAYSLEVEIGAAF